MILCVQERQRKRLPLLDGVDPRHRLLAPPSVVTATVVMSLSEAEAKRFFERGPDLECPASLKIDASWQPKVLPVKQRGVQRYQVRFYVYTAQYHDPGRILPEEAQTHPTGKL